MTKKVVVLDDDFLKKEAPSIAPLAAGSYTVVIESVEETTVKSGSHAGKPALNVKLRHESNRVFWKLVPMFAVTAKSDKNLQVWVQMSRVSLVDALGITNIVLQANPESLVGESVDVILGITEDAVRGPVNVVKRFA